ncbi:MAG: TRAP transporter substrate-binding protein [Pseudomonadota bacterium]
MDRRRFLSSATLATGASALAAPAVAANTLEFVIVSSWPRDFPGLGISAQRLAARLVEASGGEIDVQYFAAGERVGAFDVFDDVSSGNSQAYISADYYFKGKHPAWAPFSTIPFGLTYTELDAWIKFQGGQALWDELAGEFNLKNLACGNTGVQMGGWFNKEINSPDDFRGLKMRIPGLGGDMLAKLGASPVSLPGGQIYENLVSGAIDATEWVGPYNDYFMKFYEAAKYYYWPGVHEPGTQLSLGINRDFWHSLSDAHRALIEAVSHEENARQMAEANANNGFYLNKMITENGVELREFDIEIFDAYAEASAEVIEEAREHSELSARIFDSVLRARTELASWGAISDVAFAQKRNAALGL